MENKMYINSAAKSEYKKKSCSHEILLLRHTIFFDAYYRGVRWNIERYRGSYSRSKSENGRDAIANLPNDFSHKPKTRPCACEATCSDSNEPSAGPVVLQLAKRFPRHRICSAILDHREKEGWDSLSIRQYSTCQSTRITTVWKRLTNILLKYP